MENTNAFLEEQFNAQRTMLEDALMALDKKNKILEKSNYKLEEKRFELEQFIYRLNHDFKSPVSTIKGLTYLLDTNTVETQRIVLKLRETVNRLDTLISNLSYFYITTQINKDYAELRNVVQNVLIKFNDDLINNNIICNLELSKDVNKLKIAIADFDAILGSLLSNSINYSDNTKTVKEIHIKITKKQDMLCLTVSDNGIGIETAYHKKVFDIFTRASTKSIGSGLGLYIVSKIVKKYEGIIELNSEIGKGTQIIIQMPLHKLY